MPESTLPSQAMFGLISELQTFLELSFQDNTLPLHDWIGKSITGIDSSCWLIQKCEVTGCPAYQNDDRRCWLIAGTLCGGKAQGKFADKYTSCTACEFYRHAVGNDPVRQLRELIIALLHSLHLRQEELRATRSELKILTGLLPICISCKKIRDDQGYWTQLESYIHKYSEAQFSHSICPNCVEKLYPGLMERKDTGP
ncbi:MAG: hypothetical protein HGA96_12880 [Desulfobulbaceae bacterium]|nr:hypothetical protein [Desulfobulbaceae bacterium]